MNAADLAEAAGPLRRLIVSFADTKRLLGIRYSDWLLGAPSIESGIAAASMCQDEWGHARLLYAMLKEFDVDPKAIEHQRPASEYCSASCLDEPFGDWAAVVAGVVVVDGALSFALEGFAAGSFEAARRRVPKMLAEEAFHHDFGHAWLTEIGSGSQEGRARLAAAMTAMLPAAVSCLLPDDREARLLARLGIVADPHRARVEFAQRLEAPFTTLELAADTDPPRPADWDARRCRPAGSPSRDAVERARGDRNRALFVE